MKTILFLLCFLPLLATANDSIPKSRYELRHERKMKRLEIRNHKIELRVASGRFSDSVQHLEEIAKINADYGVRIAKINRNIERIHSRLNKVEVKQKERTKRVDSIVYIFISIAICLFLLLLVVVILKNKK